MKDTLLFFSYWYPYPGNPGQGLFVKRHAQAIAKQKDILVLAVHVIKGKGFFQSSLHIEKDEQQVETHHLYLSSIFPKLLYVCLPLQTMVIRKHIQKIILQKNTIRILHSNVLFPCAIVGNTISRKLGFKQVVTEHWSKIDKFFRVSIYKNLGKRALAEASAITCVSESLLHTLSRYTTPTHCSVVPNVIDHRAFFYQPQINKHAVFSFIAVAHWNPPKNPLLFVQALESLQKEHKLPPFELVMVGMGPLLDQIKTMPLSFPIRNIKALAPTLLAEELNRCHVFLHGSDYETFSVVIAEALSCGLPVVVSDVGIAREVVNAQNGFICDANTEDWKKNIELCVNKSYDASHISEQMAQRYSEEKVGQQFMRLYQKLSS